MKEYKAERLVHAGSTLESVNNSLNIAALGDWELVCVSEGFAYYVRERRTAAALEAAEKGERDG